MHTLYKEYKMNYELRMRIKRKPRSPDTHLPSHFLREAILLRNCTLSVKSSLVQWLLNKNLVPHYTLFLSVTKANWKRLKEN